MSKDLQIIKELEKELGVELEKNESGIWASNCKAYRCDIIGDVTALGLYNMELTQISQKVLELKKLRILSLHSNKFAIFPSEITQFKNLDSLDLGGNHLTTLPPEIAQLKNLYLLNLSGNQLTSLPSEIVQLKNLGNLYLSGNPLKSPPLEIVEKGIKAIFEYLEQIAKQEKEAGKGKAVKRPVINEAKMILVGQGDVGKTCLAERLVHDRFEKQPSTEGIDILEWNIPSPANEDIQLHIWDFGGQEIYHATHQFFLTKRSVYILVWNARKSHDYEHIYYWLHTIEAFGDDSPIILVMSKCKERDDDLNMKDLRQRFPQIAGLFKIDSQDGTGINDLKEIISQTSWNLPQMSETWIINWLKIRNELERLKKEEKKDWIPYEVFLQICEQYGLSKTEIDLLDGYLHDLGIIIHFQEPLELKNMLILNPEWATNAVYKVLDTQAVRAREGILLHSELEQIWDIEQYPTNLHHILLELMNKFELAYRLPDILPNKQSHLVAELLPSTEPPESVLNWDYKDNLCFYYKYDFLPAGVLTRVIVRIHENLEFKDDTKKLHLCWREGAILQRDNTRAFVKVRPLDKIIQIRIQGQRKRELLAIIRNHFDHINEKIKKVKIVQEIPCNCVEACQNVFNYNKLLAAEAKGKPTVECQTSWQNVQLSKLLDGYEEKEKREENFSSSINIHGDYISGDKRLKQERNIVRSDGDTFVAGRDNIGIRNINGSFNKESYNNNNKFSESAQVQPSKTSIRKKIGAFIAGSGVMVGLIWGLIQIYDWWYPL